MNYTNNNTATSQPSKGRWGEKKETEDTLGSGNCTSDEELDKAVVVVNVALKDVLTGPKDTFKPLPIQLSTPQLSLGTYCGCPRSLQQQGNLTYIVLFK